MISPDQSLHTETGTPPDSGGRPSVDGSASTSGQGADQLSTQEQRNLFLHPNLEEKEKLLHTMSLAEKARLYKQFSPEEKRWLYSQLSPQEQQHVAGISSPNQKVSNEIWLIVVWSFAIVLVGTFASLAASVFIDMFKQQTPANATNLQLLLTVFTSAAGLLAGILVPSPTHSHS